MGAASFGAGLWLAICIGEPPAGQIALAPMAIGYLLAGFVPVWFSIAMCGRRTGCSRGVARAQAQGDRATAMAILARIRRRERLWRFGDSLLFRVSLALWAIGTAVGLCILARYLGRLARDRFWSDTALTTRQIQDHLMVAGAVSLFAPLEAMLGYCEAWRQPWTLDDCGDRLWHLLFGPKDLANSAPVADNEVSL